MVAMMLCPTFLGEQPTTQLQYYRSFGMSRVGEGAAVKRRILAYLDERGINQVELGRLMGKGQTSVQPWVTGKSAPSADSLVKLCSALGISGHWLLTGEGPVEAPGTEPGITSPYALGYRAGWRAAFEKFAGIARAAPTADDESALRALGAGEALLPGSPEPGRVRKRRRGQ